MREISTCVREITRKQVLGLEKNKKRYSEKN